MNHKLNNHPISERMIYVNDLQLANDVPYETERKLEAAATGKREMEGGILPDDNVRICVPMDLNADAVKGGFNLSFSGGLKMYDLGGLRTDRC